MNQLPYWMSRWYQSAYRSPISDGSRVKSRPGYVLLLVLFVLALAATAMTGVCRLSLEQAVHANRAEAELQRKWAVISCRSVLLPKAEAVLRREDQPSSEVRRDVRLGSLSFTLIFGDEQAKANVNFLYDRSGLSEAERGIRAIVGVAGGGMPVELHPGRSPSFATPDADSPPPAFETYGQVFGPTQPQALSARHGNLPSVVSGLTCWGDGSVNLRRASSEAVRAVLGHSLPAAQISRLLNFRAKNPDAKCSQILDLLELPEDRQDAIEDLLTDSSACHSLWIISDSGQRKWYDLAVADDAALIDGAALFTW